MRQREKPRKDTDYVTRFHCAGGIGILWVNTQGEVVKYNPAFLLPHIFTKDNGRVLEYDNAHGVHERHDRGAIQNARYKNYPALATRFYREVERIRRSYEDKSV